MTCRRPPGFLHGLVNHSRYSAWRRDWRRRRGRYGNRHAPNDGCWYDVLVIIGKRVFGSCRIPKAFRRQGEIHWYVSMRFISGRSYATQTVPPSLQGFKLELQSTSEVSSGDHLHHPVFVFRHFPYCESYTQPGSKEPPLVFLARL